MNEQEVKIKMAEMLGWERVIKDEYWNRDWYSEGDLRRGSYEDIEYLFIDEFNPQKNIEQAMEVLESLGVRWRIVKQKNGFYRVSTYSKKYDGMGFSKNAMREDLKEAIYQAVKSYLEGE